MTRTLRTVGVAVIALLVVGGGTFAFITTGQTASQSDQTQAATSVELSDQTSGPETVIVDSVTLEEGGFVTIHDTSELEAGLVQDSVIGVSTYLEAGTHEDVPVTLVQPMEEPSTEVTAMAHKDTNGNEAYDFVASGGQVDGPYTTEVQSTPTPEMEDTPTPSMTSTPASTSTPEADTTTPVQTDDDAETTTEPNATTETATATPMETDDEAENTTASDTTEENETTVEGQTDEEQSTGTPEAETPAAETSTPMETGTPTPTPSATSVTPVTDTATISVEPSVGPNMNMTFEDQSSNGTTVTVERVTLHQGGYVVIHENSLSADNGSRTVVGSTGYLDPGTYEDLQITLGTELDDSMLVQNGEIELTATAHQDENSNQAFDYAISDGEVDAPYNATNRSATASVSLDDGGSGTATPTDAVTDTPTEGGNDSTPTADAGTTTTEAAG